MNTISSSSSQSVSDLYYQKKIEAEKELQEYQEQKKKQQEYNNDYIQISQQGMAKIDSSSMISANNSALSSLVEDGTLTQDQADAIQNIFQSGMGSIKTSGTYGSVIKPQSPLNSLVESGTITEDQKSAVESAFEAAIKANKSENNTSNSGTEEQSDNPLASLIEDGTITQDQADAVKSLLDELRDNDKKVQDNKTNDSTSILETLVENGTLTQDQADAIESIFESGLEGMKF